MNNDDESHLDRASLKQVVASIKQAVEAKDAYTLGHNERVAVYAANLARAIGLDSDAVERIQFGGQLHDVGKIGVANATLRKPTGFNADEVIQIQQHSKIGYDLCEPLGFDQVTLDIIRHHHERIDGSGYPDGLRGSQISLAVQIVSVADVVDALLTTRVYRNALTIEDTWDILYDEAVRGLHDLQLVEACIQIMVSGEFFRGRSGAPSQSVPTCTDNYH